MGRISRAGSFVVDDRAVAARLGGKGRHAAVGGKQAVVGLVVADRVFRQVELGKAAHDLVAVNGLEWNAYSLIRRANPIEHESIRRAKVESADLEAVRSRPTRFPARARARRTCAPTARSPRYRRPAG